MTLFDASSRPAIGLLSVLGFVVACSGGSTIPEPTDDASPPPDLDPQTGATTGAGGAATSSATSTVTVGTGGGTTMSTTAGTGGAAPFTPDCVCLLARAEDTFGCTSCCRSCFDAAEIGACINESDACNSDVNGCQIAIDLAKACPPGAGYAQCVTTAYDLAPTSSLLLAQALLDCTCGSCAAECGTGDTCP